MGLFVRQYKVSPQLMPSSDFVKHYSGHRYISNIK